MFLTTDQVRVTVHAQGLVDPQPWQSVYGGEANYSEDRSRLYTDLVLKRVVTTETLGALVWYMRNLTHGVTVQVAHLDPDGEPTGTGILYDGVLRQVVPPFWDNNKSDVALERIVIEPATVSALVPEGGVVDPLAIPPPYKR